MNPKVIHFSILGQTLCGAGDEPIEESRADTAEFCDDCVQAMWKEQYRRSVLLKVDMTEKPKKKKAKKKTEVVTEPMVVRPPRMKKPLRSYLRVVE